MSKITFHSCDFTKFEEGIAEEKYSGPHPRTLLLKNIFPSLRWPSKPPDNNAQEVGLSSVVSAKNTEALTGRNLFTFRCQQSGFGVRKT